MSHAHLVVFTVRRAAGVVAVVVTSALLSVSSAFGQTSGEAHVVAIRGGDSAFRLISAGIVVGATVRGGRIVPNPKGQD